MLPVHIWLHKKSQDSNNFCCGSFKKINLENIDNFDIIFSFRVLTIVLKYERKLFGNNLIFCPVGHQDILEVFI